ncbi:hypothetical protein Pan44_25880 [Caulifigura coniformis]|uniref:Uncharacterized protein n=2 Tax=Caulifigura coniformis TaxID=2527983 RepID=A0A517SEK5_9PLAN|nr:hypothetical protein Pan44_25880 [Caulifigura coniformis]
MILRLLLRMSPAVVVVMTTCGALRADGLPPAPRARLEHSTTILVVDEEEKPVPGALVTSADFPSPDWAMPVTTDDNGLATLAWPRYSPGASASILVDRADFILQPGLVPIGSSPHRVTLRHPSSIRLMARLPGEEGRAWGLTPDFGDLKGLHFTEDEGLLAIHRLDLAPRGPDYLIRLVHLSEQGSCYFSETIDLRQIDPGKSPPTFPLQKGLEFRGRLGVDVPRPVQDGTVYAVARPASTHPRFADWTRVVPVTPDGEFIVDSLPPNSGLELLVLCKGWTSAPPAEADARAFEKLFPRREPPHEMSVAVMRKYASPQAAAEVATIPMEPRATTRIRVTDSEGAPVEGAIVKAIPFDPLPGDDDDSIRLLELRRAGAPTPSPDRLPQWRETTTDSSGIAHFDDGPPGLVKDVPTLLLALQAHHPDWKSVSIHAALKAPFNCTLRFRQPALPPDP